MTNNENSKKKKVGFGIRVIRNLGSEIRLRTWVSLGVLIILLPLAVVYMFSASEAEASWFDDTYAYRQRFEFTHNAAVNDYRAVTFSLDTAELVTANVMESDCDDTRFTDINGKPLLFDLTGTCDDAATTYEVIFEKIFNGTNAGYVYYGNPSARNSEIDSTVYTALTPSGGDPGITTRTAEEQGPAPLAYWKFDEGVNDTCGSNDACDNSSGANDGTFGASTAAPSWQTEDMCINGKCLYFDGSNDTVTVSNTVAGVQAVSFWIKVLSTGTTEQILDLNGTDYFTSVNGTVTVNGFGTNTVYVDGVPGTALSASRWHHVEITTTTGFSASAITIGNVSTNFGNIFLDEVKIYNYARSQAQVRSDSTGGSSDKGITAELGTQNQKYLSDGLVGYWKLDESSGSAADSSGYGTALTNNSATAYSGAKYGRGAEPDGTADYLSASDNSTLSITGNITLSAWIQPDDTTGQQNIIGKWDGTNNSYLLAITGDELIMYIDSASNYKTTTSANIPANVFTHVAGVYEANAGIVRLYVNGIEQAGTVTGTIPNSIGDDGGSFVLGADNSPTNYFDGHIDEARVYRRALSGGETQTLSAWAPGPVASYNFDDDNSSTLFDRSTYGNNGVIVGSPQFEPGKNGKGLHLTGTSQIVNMGNGSSLQIVNGITVSAWIKKDSVNPAAYPVILSKTSAADDLSYILNYDSTAANVRFIVGDSAGGLSGVATTTAPSTGQWHYITGTADGTYVKIYVDGVLRNTQSQSITIVDGADPPCIGGYSDATDCDYRKLGGTVDNVQIYNYARTPGQIVADMNAGHPLGGSPVASQIGYWAFDEIAGSTVYNTNPSQLTLTGSITEAVWTSQSGCKYNSCLDFDGSNDVVTVTNADSIDFDTGLHDSFTYSAWINPDTVGEGSNGQIFVKNTSTYCQLGGSDPFNITCSVNTTSVGGTDATLTVSSIIPADAWTHVAVGWTDDSDDELTIWVNGRNMGSSTNGVGSLETDTSNLLIGGGTSNNFDGTIDEFKVYSAELTGEQMRIDYNANSAVNFGVGSNIFPSQFGTGPIGYWSFDDGSENATVRDVSGNGHNSSNSIKQMGPGHIGKGLRGIINDGADVNRVDIPDHNDLDFTNTEDFTISAWISARSVEGTDHPIIDKGAESTSNTGYMIRLESSGAIRCRYSDGSISLVNNDNLEETTSTPGNLFDGQIHHALCLMDWDGSEMGTAGMYLFWDGILVDTDTNIGEGDGSSTQDLWLGERTTGVEWNGVLDEVKIWGRSLNLNEIEYEYNNGKPTAYWQFEDCEGSTAYDTGGYSQHENGFNAAIYPTSLGNTTVGTCGSGTGTEMWNDGTQGKRNGSLGFDGSDDYAEVADSGVLRFDAAAEDFSTFAWVKRVGTGEENIISKEDADNDGWRMQFTSGDAVRCSVDAIDIDSSSTITDTNWHFIGCSIDRSGNGQVYIDGFANGTPTAISSEAMANTSNIRIGTRSYTSTNYFEGQIDELVIYRYALTLAQVRRVMNSNAAARFGPLEGSP